MARIAPTSIVADSRRTVLSSLWSIGGTVFYVSVGSSLFWAGVVWRLWRGAGCVSVQGREREGVVGGCLTTIVMLYLLVNLLASTVPVMCTRRTPRSSIDASSNGACQSCLRKVSASLSTRRLSVTLSSRRIALSPNGARFARSNVLFAARRSFTSVGFGTPTRKGCVLRLKCVPARNKGCADDVVNMGLGNRCPFSRTRRIAVS